MKGVLAAVLLWFAYGKGYKAADSEWRLLWVQRDLGDMTISFHHELSERAQEQRYQRAIDEERNRANAELAKVKSDRDAADRAAGGMRSELKALQQQLADSETGRLTASVKGSASTAKAAVLLAELLSEADGMAGRFATEADRAYAAGSSCERSYDGLTKKQRNSTKRQNKP